MSERPTIVAGLASIPSRKGSLTRTLRSLLSQVDRVVVHLNGYEVVPQFLRQYAVEIIHGPDVGDAGKFTRVLDCDGYFLSCDDDLLYPPDYAERLISAIEERGRQTVCGFHGGIYRAPYQDAIHDRDTYRCLDEVKDDHVVDLLGTGVMGFHAPTVPIWPGLFRHPNMADIWFAVHARRMGIELVALGHRAGWLEDINGGGPQIFRSTRARDGSARDTRERQEEQIRGVAWAEPARRARVAVAIATCERPASLLDVLRDLDGEYVDVTACVFEDCSSGYDAGREFCVGRGWEWWRSPERLGKRRHYELVGAELAWMESVDADWFLFLPDDIRLERHALARAIELWDQLDAPDALSIAHLRGMSGASWTNVTPRRQSGEVVEVGWIDGMFLCRRGLLEALDYRVYPVTNLDWDARPRLSSGVGAQLSRRLVSGGARLYRVEHSLVRFVDMPSVMNPEDRAVLPAVAL